MKPITVDKARLIKKLKKNRKAHRDIFLKAQEGYRRKWIEVLDQRLADAKAGRNIEQYINLPVPEDHTDDFDSAIEMMEWEKGDEVILDEQMFRALVQNKWAWAQSFAGTTLAYAPGGALS